MTLTEIKWIAVLYEVGNISKAAEQLFISQPALSQCLRRVEDELGFPLFQRSGKRIMPTKNAALFYKMAGSILDTFDDFIEKAHSGEDTQPREIRIALPVAIHELVYIELVSEFRKLYPDISLRLSEASASEMWEALIRRTTDIIISNNISSSADIIKHPIMDIDTLILLRSSSSAAAHIYTENGIRFLDPGYLKNEPLAAMRKGHTSRQITEALCSTCGFSPNIIQETKSVHTLFSCVNEELCSAIRYPFPGSEFESSEHVYVCRVPKEYPFSVTQLSLVTLHETENSIPSGIFNTICRIVRSHLT